MLRELLTYNRRHASVSQGECIELQINPDTGQPCNFCLTTPSQFIDDWGYAMDSVRATAELCQKRWMGVVHCDGAVLVSMDR